MRAHTSPPTLQRPVLRRLVIAGTNDGGTNIVPAKISAERDSARSLADFPELVGRKLKLVRVRQGYSLDDLAKRSGVSRAMLGQIETGKSVPTIVVLWKIASALGVALTHLLPTQPPTVVVMRREGANFETSSAGQFKSRPIFDANSEPSVLVFELCIRPSHRERMPAGPPGAKATLVVASGTVKFAVNGAAPIRLNEGDAVLFRCGEPYSTQNVGARAALLYLVQDVPKPFGQRTRPG